jgi:hypothetical protein
MHGRTFNVLTMGQNATLWGPRLESSPHARYYGKCGVIIAKDGEPRRGHGFVTLRFPDGHIARVMHHNVALGDNSRASED